MSWITESFRRWMHSEPAPPAPKSLVYALCEEYRQQSLWSAYHAFRLDPQARTWHRLRGWSVPWQGEQTVADLFARMHPMHGKRTPDATSVELALLTVPTFAKKKR